MKRSKKEIYDIIDYQDKRIVQLERDVGVLEMKIEELIKSRVAFMVLSKKAKKKLSNDG